MSQFIEQFIEQLIATSVLEWLAVLLAISYLLLAVKENSWCWPAAFFSTAIYSYLFFDVNLYMESALNIYYLVMAVYGWFQWQKRADSSNTASSSSKQLLISTWSKKKHLMIIIATLVLVFVTSYLLNQFTNQDLAFLDSLTSWFAVITTYMVTQKILENWLYWIVIDSLSIYLYILKGFALTSVLFCVYVVIAFIGWRAWKKHYEKRSA